MPDPTPAPPASASPVPVAPVSTVASSNPAPGTSPHEVVAALAAKHITVSYILIGALLFVLSLGGVGAYFAAKWVDKAIARAEASEKLMVQYKEQYDALDAAYQKEAAQHAADRLADAAKLAALAQSRQAVDQKANTTISAVLVPGKTADAVMADLKNAYKDIPKLNLDTNISKDASGDQLLAFPIFTVQQFTATKLDRDRLFSDTVSLQSQLDLETRDNATLTTDYKSLQDVHAALVKTEATCEQTVKDYKKVVVVSKWRKVWNGAKKGGEIAIALLAGYELGRHI